MRALRRSNWKETLGVVALALLSNTTVLLNAPRLLAFGAGFALTYLLPGYLLTRLVLRRKRWPNRLERVALAVGMGFAASILGSLLLHDLPGPLNRTLLLIAYDVLIAGSLAVIHLRGRGSPGGVEREAPPGDSFSSSPRWSAIALSALVLIAAFIRFGNLGYSEFQGDEARAVLVAAGVVRGEDDILYLHRKGPGEILLPASFYSLHGTIDEFTARLPFALANLAGLLAIYALVRRTFLGRAPAAVVAVGLLAVDGYLVAFARIVQYQSVVFLMLALAAWSFHAWYRGRGPKLALLAAFFVAVGTLAHYEAITILPFMAGLFYSRARRERWPPRRWLRRAAGPTILFLLVTGVFYIPYICHPNFVHVFQYIAEQRVGEEILYNNLGKFFDLATFYSSTYYVVFLSLGVVVLIIHRLRRALRSTLPVAVILLLQIALVIGLGVAAFFPRALVVGGFNLAFLPLAVPVAVLILSPRLADETRAVLLWWSGVFFVAMFFMRKPKTHVYLMSPAWAILTGLILDDVGRAIERRLRRFSETGRARRRIRAWRAGAALLAVALLVIFGYYVYIVVGRHTPDYLRGYPATRPAFYPVVYGDTLPRPSGFGLPHRAGWKAIGALYAQGVLEGSYISNEEPLITSWYIRQAAWCWNAPDYYFIAGVVHDDMEIPEDVIRYENHLVARVWSGGRPTIEIYGRQPVDVPRDYDLAQLEPVFDAAAGPDVWIWAPRNPTPSRRVEANLGARARLAGFDAPDRVAAGGRLPVVLYWEPLSTFDQDYKVFVHLAVEGEQAWGQSDAMPACGSRPTTTWQPFQMIADGHSLPIDPATPPGEYALLAGLYLPSTGARLPVAGSDVNPGIHAVRLGMVEVVAPAAWEDRP